MTKATILCPKCQSSLTYYDGMLNVCSNCTYEWTNGKEIQEVNQDNKVKDSNGNVLADGDDIILIKDLKLNGSSTVLKKGSKAKNIKLVDGDHEIDCKMDGIKIMLKACFVKKA